jgi:hypothetical protein
VNRLTRIMQFSNEGRFDVPVAGTTLPLTVAVARTFCGDITDGVVFEFGAEGGWVISLATLKEIVAEAEKFRGIETEANP